MMCIKHESGVRFALTMGCALCTLCGMNQSFDVKALRERIGWTQEQLAQFLGVDRSSISRMENGQTLSGPVLRLLIILAAAADAGTADTLLTSDPVGVEQ
ncbi:MAG: XRE family transcriptional regulator [Mesorhizobium sp.]|nr:MAG: XRE family transcriptional regulator [Mesorhizobium sp.]